MNPLTLCLLLDHPLAADLIPTKRVSAKLHSTVYSTIVDRVIEPLHVVALLDAGVQELALRRGLLEEIAE